MILQEKWIGIKIRVNSVYAEALANFLLEWGGEGLGEDITEEGETILTFYLPAKEKEAFLGTLGRYLDDLADLFPETERATFQVEELENEDWGAKWREYFKPLQVGKRFVIAPSWENYEPNQGEILIKIDPGMAFGTGHHQSTALCLEAMEDLVSSGDCPLGEALDLGTGTGILAIGAVKLGFPKVTCLDIDPQAVEIAQKNAQLNEVASCISVHLGDITVADGSYALILANITSKALKENGASMARLIRPSGRVIVSGILIKEGQEIKSFFARRDFYLWRELARDEWLCLVFGREEK